MLRRPHVLRRDAILVMVIVCWEIDFVVVVRTNRSRCCDRIRANRNRRYFHAKTTAGVISATANENNIVRNSFWIECCVGSNDESPHRRIHAHTHTHLRTLNCGAVGALRLAESPLLELLLFDDVSDAYRVVKCSKSKMNFICICPSKRPSIEIGYVPHRNRMCPMCRNPCCYCCCCYWP